MGFVADSIAKHRKEYFARKKKKERPGEYHGMRFVSGEELNKIDAHRREMELAAQKNKAAKDLQGMQNKGNLATTKARQKAISNRAGLDRAQKGKKLQATMDLSNRKLQMKRNQNLLSRFKELTTDKVDELSGKVLSKGLPNNAAMKQLVAEREAFNKNFGSALNRGMTKGSQQSAPDRIIQLGDRSWTNIGGAGGSGGVSNPGARRPTFDLSTDRDRGRGSFTRESGRESVYDRLKRQPVNSALRKYWDLPI